MFECSLIFAQDELLNTNQITEACVPWFFPPPDDSNVMCDPWETMAFLDMMDRVTDDKLVQSVLLNVIMDIEINWLMGSDFS